MQSKREYRQSSKAIIINYLTYRWIFALLTYGILLAYDLLKYRKTKLVISKDAINLSSGLFSARTNTVSYQAFRGLSTHQSTLGRFGEYGTVRMHLKDGSTHSLKFADNPQQLASLLHKLAQAAGANVQSAEEYEVLQRENKLQKLAEAKARQSEKYAETGKCPRCGSTSIQPIVEHATYKGSGWSFTRRMCMNCSKKFR